MGHRIDSLTRRLLESKPKEIGELLDRLELGRAVVVYPQRNGGD